MKVGVNLINFGPAARPEVLAGWVEMTERLGYHSLLTSDHLAVTPDVTAMYPAPFYEPTATLGWLAAATPRVQIGTTVTILPYRNPLELARSYATVVRVIGQQFAWNFHYPGPDGVFGASDVTLVDETDNLAGVVNLLGLLEAGIA